MPLSPLERLNPFKLREDRGVESARGRNEDIRNDGEDLSFWSSEGDRVGLGSDVPSRADEVCREDEPVPEAVLLNDALPVWEDMVLVNS